MEDVVGKCGVLWMNEDGRKLIESCTEKKLSVRNKFIEKDIHKFTRVRGVDDRKSLLELIVVQEEDRNKLLDASVFKDPRGRISDHHLVVAKI